MHQITVAHDGTLTRAGAALMRENGVTTVTGSTTLTQARAAARKAGLTDTFEFVSATRPERVVKAKRARKATTTKVAPVVAKAKRATAWECGHTSLREHIAARCNGSKASA